MTEMASKKRKPIQQEKTEGQLNRLRKIGQDLENTVSNIEKELDKLEDTIRNEEDNMD